MSLCNAFIFHLAGVAYGVILGGYLTLWVIKKRARSGKEF
jgi:hypothetical protein